MSSAKNVSTHLQEMYELLGYKDNIIWDTFKKTENKELRKKIILVVGILDEPEEPNMENMSEKDYAKAKECAKKNHQKNMELIDNICASLWRQAKYTGGHLVMAISYVCTINENNSALNSGYMCTKYSTIPVFRVKKCQKDFSSDGCCMTFVDIYGRVYPSWEAYKDENILPACLVVAPVKGIFMGKQTNSGKCTVILEEFLSPAAQPKSKVANIVDKTSSTVGLTSSAILLGAMVPIAAPFLLPLAGAAAVSGVICSGWSVIRSGQNLADRSKHEQSIELSNSEARGSWFGVAGGGLGLAAGGAGKIIGSMASNGTNISPFIRWGFNGLNFSVLVVNGLGTINGFVDVLFIDDQPVTATQVLQLSASLFMFTHSVYNFQTATSIIKSNQNLTMRDVRENLSRNQRRAFDKMAKETIRLQKETAGKVDIVRSLRKIEDHKSYFRDMHKINKALNQANIKPSFSGDSQPLLNNKPANAMPSEIRANLRGAPPAQVFGDVIDDPYLKGASKPGQLNLTSNINPINWISPAVSVLSKLPHLIDDNIRDTLANIAKLLTKRAFDAFVNFVKDFVFDFGAKIEKRMNRAIDLEEHIFKIFHIFEKIASDFERTIAEQIERIRPVKNENLAYMEMVYQHYESEFLPIPNTTCVTCGGMYFESI